MPPASNTSHQLMMSPFCFLRTGTKANDYGFATTDTVKGETHSTGALLRNFGRYLGYTGHWVRDLDDSSALILIIHDF